MTNQEAIADLETLLAYIPIYRRFYQPISMGIKALEQTKWIPVSERLPKESDGIVLITVNGKVKTGKYSEFSNTWYKGDMCGVGGDDPIAWKPLPEPYKAESDNCN